MNAELFKRYAEDVQERFGLSREQMFAKKKQQEYVDARQMLYLLCDRSVLQVRDLRLRLIPISWDKDSKGQSHTTGHDNGYNHE